MHSSPVMLGPDRPKKLGSTTKQYTPEQDWNVAETQLVPSVVGE